jgi:hypothetical protein
MGGTTGANARLLQRIPLAAGAEHEEDGIHGFTIIDAGPMTPQRVWFTRGKQRHNALPQLVRDTPVTTHLFMVIRPQRGSKRRRFSPQDIMIMVYWDSL